MVSMVGGSRGAARGLGLMLAAGVTASVLAGCGPAISGAVPSAHRHAAASIAVEPSRWLSQGQRVQVAVRGFPPHVKVFVSECARLTGISPLGCGTLRASHLFLVTNGRGAAEGRFVVQVVAATGPAGSRMAKCWPGCTLVATTGAPAYAAGVVADAVIRFGERHPPPPPSSRVPATAPFTVLASIRVPGRAWQVLAAGGRLYSLSVAGATGFEITRVGPVTGRVGPSRRVAGVAGMGFGGGLLWVIRHPPSSHGAAPSLLALNPATLAIVHTVALPQQPGWGPSRIAYAGGLIWIAGTHSLIAINPATMTLAETVPVGSTGGFTGIAASPGGTALWTTEATPGGGGPVAVQRRDPHTGTALAAINGPAGSLGGAQIAAASDRAWLAYWTGMQGGYTQVVDRDGRLAGTPPPERHRFANGIEVYLAGRRLWILDGMTGSIACASDTTGRILAAVYDTAMSVSDLAPLAPARLALPINGKVLIVRPKPPCGP